jgi:hypothetical protein
MSKKKINAWHGFIIADAAELPPGFKICIIVYLMI